MSPTPVTARDRAEMYAVDKNLTICIELGGGFDGIVLGPIAVALSSRLIMPDCIAAN